MSIHPLVVVIGLLAIFLPMAEAAIVIRNFQIDANRVSFDIEGTMPDEEPGWLIDILFFVNDYSGSPPGFALGTFPGADAVTFTGTRQLLVSVPVATGYPEVADYFYVAFADDLAAGELIEGTLSATWSETAFDPARIENIRVSRGVSNLFPKAGNGIFLTTVPEPSAAVFAVVAFVFSLRRTRRRVGGRVGIL